MKHPSWIRVAPRPFTPFKAIPRDEVYQCLVEIRRGCRAGKRRDLIDAALEWLNDGTRIVILQRFGEIPSPPKQKSEVSRGTCEETHAEPLQMTLDTESQVWYDGTPWPKDEDFDLDEDERKRAEAGAL